MLLTEARTTLRQSVLHVGECTFPIDQLDRAIRRAGEYLLRETGLVRAVITGTLASGAKTLDVTGFTNGADFHPGLMVSPPYIRQADNDDYFALEVASLRRLLHLHDETTATGKPEVIGWQTNTTALVFPTADANYTLAFNYEAGLTSWTPGDMGAYSASTTYNEGAVVSYTDNNTYRSLRDDNTGNTPGSAPVYWELLGATSSYPISGPTAIDINVPDRYADEWLHTGGKWALIGGAFGHEDGPAARRDWEDFIKRVRSENWPSGVHVPGLRRGNRGAYQLGSY